MNARTLRALKASIEKWKRRAKNAGEFIPPRVSDCPLCDVYATGVLHPPCIGCPVAERSGVRYCHGTPYERYNATRACCPAATKARFIAAMEEAEFLRSLLPEPRTMKPKRKPRAKKK